MADCPWRLGEESGANPERSRHCEPPTTRSAEARASPVAGRARRARPVHRRGRGTRRRLAVTCATVRTTLTTPGHAPASSPSRPSSAPTTWPWRSSSRPSRPRWAACSCAARRARRSRRWCAASPPCSPAGGRRRLPFRLRPRRRRPAAPTDRTTSAPRPRTRAARLVELPDRRDRGPRRRVARPRAGAGTRRDGIPAGAARGREPRHPLRRRGQPPPRPPRRPAARRGGDGPQHRRARRGLRLARGPHRARRHDEPRGGRAAPAAARPLRPHRRGRRARASPRCAPRSYAAGWPSTRRPGAFVARFEDDQQALRERIADARSRVGAVTLTDAVLTRIATVCAAFEVDGLRADIVTARAAVAHAAWSGRTTVTVADVRAAARLALPHRRRRNPFDSPGLDEDLLDAAPRRRRARSGARARPGSGRRRRTRARRPRTTLSTARRSRARRRRAARAGDREPDRQPEPPALPSSSRRPGESERCAASARCPRLRQ